MLDIASNIKYETSITKYRYHMHQPLASTTYSYNDEIHFQVQNQDEYSLPSQSVLVIEGKIKKNAVNQVEKKSEAADISSADDVIFVQNGIAFLFEECRFLLNGTEIDKTRNLGQTTLMKGLCSFTQNESKSYKDAGWMGFASTLYSTNKEIYFTATIPLKLLLGFAEDYKQIICSIRQDLILVRARDDKNALFTTSTNVNPEVEISKVIWMLPVIDLSDAARVNLLSIVKKDPALKLAFRSWEMYENPSLPHATCINWTITSSTQLEKPRFVIISFQTAKKHTFLKKNDNYDHINVKDIKLFLNSEFYPYSNMNLDFEKKQISFLYYLYSIFQNSFYNRNVSNPLIDREEFIQNYPLFVFDTTYQNDKLKNSIPVDIRVEIQTSTNVPPNTSCYCLIIHDRVVEYTPISNIVRRL